MKTPTVWKEEVNKALIEYTRKAVQFTRNGALYVPPVQMRKPDESLKLERYPCITWYNLMDLPNVYRTDNVPHNVYNSDTKSVATVYSPIPYDMYYQLDFWAKNWGDIDIMTQKWSESLPPFSRGLFFNLPVVDSNGDETSVLCLQKDILRRRDTLTDGQKLLHSTVTYGIQGYIGREYSESKDVVLDINVSRKGLNDG